MIKSIGIDCVRISRINLRYLKYLSQNELKLVNSFSSIERKKEFSAGRWALKEAIYKALPLVGSNFSNIDILYNELKQPSFKFKNYKIFLSLSHEKDIAIGICIVESI